MNKNIVIIGLLSACIGSPAFAAMPIMKNSEVGQLQLLARDGAERSTSGETKNVDRMNSQRDSIKVASDGAEHLEKWHQQNKKA